MEFNVIYDSLDYKKAIWFQSGLSMGQCDSNAVVWWGRKESSTGLWA